MTPERRRQRIAAALEAAQKAPVPGDDAPRVLVVARERAARAEASERLAALGFVPKAAERIEALTAGDFRDVDAVLLVSGRTSVPARIALAHLRALAPTCAVVLASSGSEGPREAGVELGAIRWPAAEPELLRVLRRALAGAAASRRLDALRAPARMHLGLPTVVALGGRDGHPGWFLDALLSTFAEGISGGAVLTPASDGLRVLEVRGIRESYVLRLAHRHPPAVPESVRHVRMGRTLRSTAAQLRALREWWWLPGPPCAGAGGLTFLFQVRGAPDLPWLHGTMELIAAGLDVESRGEDGFDPETGLPALGATALAHSAAAVARHARRVADGSAGAAVVLLTMPDLREERREHGPRAESRILTAALGRIRRAGRPQDRLVRLGPETVGLVVPARGARDAERLADRVLARFDDGRLLRRAGEDAGGGGAGFELDVRAVFVDGSEDPETLAETLARLGVPWGSPSS